MRKPIDFDAELKALEAKAKTLKERKVRQLGELVIATGADTLDMEVLAGGLLGLVQITDAARKEGWRKKGQAFFQGRGRDAGGGASGDDHGAEPSDCGQASA
ncbi:conjugal transfer protein TraD [Phenylobacterium montanum]|uniref:Conjugal transfer protein TraD n=1 Tax=Phenylobacterium montanum TaxID=2823693 RepID=A0A975G3E4_9CAUL|nr:conjugal transfer protein TraD [Caulobacter sp. S6]QUD89842.1 conjugal transfer protein TraD [Caulobacter sp. S6]